MRWQLMKLTDFTTVVDAFGHENTQGKQEIRNVCQIMCSMKLNREALWEIITSPARRLRSLSIDNRQSKKRFLMTTQFYSWN